MNRTVLKGDIVSSESLTEIKTIKNGYICLERGRIVSVSDTLPEEFADAVLYDYSDMLIMQSFCDMHLHAPQYPMLGLGMNLPLVDWLSKYAYPMESRFADPEYARKVYRRLAHDLISHGTTRVAMFSSLHTDSTIVLMEELEKAGITGYVGKVNMDRNGSPILQETTEESKRETLRWLEESNRFSRIKPILTPRFTPSCTDELMSFLGELSGERDLPVQSHISENISEIEWVKQLRPECEEYWDTYHDSGLWHERTLMAHCVHSSERERKAIAGHGVTVVHCCNSNTNISSGVMPLRKMLDENIKVVLGSDISGGNTLNGFDVVASTVQTSKVRSILDNWETDHVNETEAWYLATSAAAPWFGAKAGFAPGNMLHAIVLDDSKLMRKGLSVMERFSRCFYKRQPGSIRAVWSEGEPAFMAD